MTTAAPSDGSSNGVTLGVDVGGTFTDAVLVVDDGGGHTAGVYSGKTPTTPEDQSVGVLAAAALALDEAGLRAVDVDTFVHGMTVTTNAMLEGDFARTALLATRGFTDLEALGRQNRPDLYDLCRGRAAPIVPRELRFAVDERCVPEGVLTPLDEDALGAAIEQLRGAHVEAVAVCLLFSFRHPAHELRVGELLARELPDAHVSLSHEVVGTFREYERLATTVADAALAPRLARYMNRLERRARDAGLPAPEVMLGNGGSCRAAQAPRLAAQTVLSGPTGGAVAVAAQPDPMKSGLIGFDMGGTSTDVCVVKDGAIRVAAGRELAGRPVALPAVDIFTVGAGGGSIAWRDGGGALRVGPRSAGALPGPAAYGHGGNEPTVTDANLLLGYLGDDDSLAGGLALDCAAAERAIEALADSLDLDAIATAAGIVEIANLEMSRATARMTVARGIDPRDHVLVAFGGAGPMHATAIADSLGVDRVLCPPACGAFSALGLAIAGRRRDVSRSVVRPLDELDTAAIEQVTGELSARARDGLGAPSPDESVTYELRYRGQSFELAVTADGAPAPQQIAAAFHAAHEREYGFAELGAPVELVTVRATAATGRRGLPATVGRTASPTAAATRPAWFAGRWHATAIWRSDGLVGPALAGPAIVQLPEATLVVPPGWTASASGGGGAIELRHEHGGDTP